jgi:hypothetical protein
MRSETKTAEEIYDEIEQKSSYRDSHKKVALEAMESYSSLRVKEAVETALRMAAERARVKRIIKKGGEETTTLFLSSYDPSYGREERISIDRQEILSLLTEVIKQLNGK